MKARLTRGREGPFVGLAVLCERIEHVGDALTLQRVVDGFTMRGPIFEPPRLFLQAMVSIRAGDVRGEHVVHFGTSPDAGLSCPTLIYVVEFTDDQQVWTEIIPVAISVNAPGRYWYEVLFDAKPITRLPLVIRHEAGDPAADGDLHGRPA